MTKKPVEGRPKAGSLDPHIVPDAKWPGIYRIRLPDGSLSDMANLTRIKDGPALVRCRVQACRLSGGDMDDEIPF